MVDDITQAPNVAQGGAQGRQHRLDVFIPGKPAPQGSKRHVGGGRMIESSKAVGPWRERVALHAAAAWSGQPMLSAPLVVQLRFVMPRPASLPKSRSTPPAVKRPDVDKLARACLDALTGVIFADDSMVVVLYAQKRLAELDEQWGVRITVQEQEISPCSKA